MDVTIGEEFILKLFAADIDDATYMIRKLVEQLNKWSLDINKEKVNIW